MKNGTWVILKDMATRSMLAYENLPAEIEATLMPGQRIVIGNKLAKVTDYSYRVKLIDGHSALVRVDQVIPITVQTMSK